MALSRQSILLVRVGLIVAIALAIFTWMAGNPLWAWALVTWIGISLTAGFLLWLAALTRRTFPLTIQPKEILLPHTVAIDRFSPVTRACSRVSPEGPLVLIVPPEPNLASLLTVLDRHQGTHAQHTAQLAARGDDLELHRQRVRRAFAWNLTNIQPYLDHVLAVEDPDQIARLPAEVDRAAELLTLGCWCAGYAYLQESPSAASRLRMARSLSLAALPIPQRDLVDPAIAHTHRLFVSVLNGYYASEHGRSVRRQRDEHFMDMYGSFTGVALESFQLGLGLALLE